MRIKASSLRLAGQTISTEHTYSSLQKQSAVTLVRTENNLLNASDGSSHKQQTKTEHTLLFISKSNSSKLTDHDKSTKVMGTGLGAMSQGY